MIKIINRCLNWALAELDCHPGNPRGYAKASTTPRIKRVIVIK